ncbi:MAG: WG repeat-containing protein [Defluviitaleaceae bacterium]|nr:WG repeat-containing protein [Defluviitaleaceae bacterium]
MRKFLFVLLTLPVIGLVTWYVVRSTEDADILEPSATQQPTLAEAPAPGQDPLPPHWTMLVQPSYEHIIGFQGGVAIVMNGSWEDGVFGLIDINGEFILPMRYQHIAHFYEEGIFAARYNDKWRFVDITGETIIELEYEWVNGFANDVAVVTSGGLSSAINIRTGEVILPMEYMWISIFNDRLDATKGEGWEHSRQYLFDLQGNEIALGFNFISRFSHGFAAAAVGQNRQDARWGIINEAGEVIIPPEYLHAAVLDENHFALGVSVTETIILNRDNYMVVPESFQFTSYLWDGMVYVQGGPLDSPQHTAGVLCLRTRSMLVPTGIYDWIHHFDTNGLAVAGMGNWGYDRTAGILDTLTGEWHVPPGQFSSIAPQVNYDLAVVAVGFDAQRREGVMELSTGRVLIEPEYHIVQILSQDLLSLGTGDGQWRIVDRSAQPITEDTFAITRMFADDLIVVATGEVSDMGLFVGSFGIINKHGEIVLPKEYSHIGWGDGPLAIINKGGTPSFVSQGDTPVTGGKWGFINQAGQVVIPAAMEFDSVSTFYGTSNLMAVQQDGLVGVIRVEY